MTAFLYPAQPLVRRHGPQGYADVESCCVYCLFREPWSRVVGTFAIDHFLPVALHPEQERRYDNLLYACTCCNAVKGKSAVPDPTAVLLDPGVRVTEFRLLWIGIIALAERYGPSLYRRLMGFPDDLPDLKRLRPPDGNLRPQGVRTSYFAKRQEGTLPATY